MHPGEQSLSASHSVQRLAEMGRQSLGVAQENLQVFPDVDRSELCLLPIVNDKPLRMTITGDQQELDAVFCSSEMFDIGARETATADDSIPGSSGPATFDRYGANASTQSHTPADHARCAARKPMLVVPFELNTGAGTICFTGK
jgi:hypothetical protein